MAALFGGCCGLGDMKSLDDSPDTKTFSPVLSLDSHVADWAYWYFKKDFKEEQNTCARLCNKFPKRKNVDINVMWDRVKFTHGTPVDADADGPTEPPTHDAAPQECNGNEETADGIPLMLKGGANNTFHTSGADAENLLESLHEESFSVKFENKTNGVCETTLSSDRRVKASYEVDIHNSVQVEHNLKLSLTVGGEESMGKVEGAYEFNKMLEQYKGEKTTKEMETTLHTECPVKVPELRTAEAKIVTTYKNYKKTLHIASRFSGRLNVEICERKKNRKKRYYKHVDVDVADVFNDLNAMGQSPVSRMLTVTGTQANQVVHYKSSATFSTSYGIEQHIQILNYELPKGS